MAVYNKEPSYNQNWVYLFIQQAKSKEPGVRIRDTQLKIVSSASKYTTHIRRSNNCNSISGRKILMMVTFLQ